MEEIMATLRSIQKDIDEQRIAIKENGIEVTKTVTENINQMLDVKLQYLENKYENLKEHTEKQEKRLSILEKQARNRNLVFFGIEENESPFSYQNMEKEFIEFINKHFEININSSDIQELRRIGKKSNKTRPIVVTLTTLGKKVEIFRQKQRLKHTNYYITEDYPQHVLEKRRALREQIKVEEERGNKAIIRYDKIVILSNNSKTITSGNNKRPLSASPQDTRTNYNDPPHKTQVHKKNKSTSSHTTLHRNSSTSEGVVKPGLLNFLVQKNSTNQTQQPRFQNE